MKTAARPALALSLAVVLRAGTAHADEQQNLVDKARITLDSFAEAQGMAEMRTLMVRARAVLIVPQFLKIGYVLGGAGGSGVLLARDPKTGVWSAPAFYTLGAGSIGFQVGASASEVVLIVLTDRGLDAMLKDKFKVGADVSAAVGPVGVGGEAATTSNLQADIVSFTRSKGLFVGASLEGAFLQPRAQWNQSYYGKAVSPADIVQKGLVTHPGAAALQSSVRRITQKPVRGS